MKVQDTSGLYTLWDGKNAQYKIAAGYMCIILYF